ncbi:hypothetical protein H257_15691 [Aphanomyces astaci]|uniref:Core-binding (CB) domain-containing protein n=1 Tax=Aphanomyces astaci TaxID=112090 RepID=W4FLK7_APHAT|nr:hypothetical protein H257_15691 [Aphanomyces astaci]ETV68370.1 hypothetical protein H257_15691 [Aphanomyces astaci]|eukprot:XP_009842165.1 hypothetical protein H257_15691 [Aphanomyces astaci]
MERTPTKQTIQDSYHGASTRSTYSTYQRQFEAFCAHHKNGLNPNAATPEDCTDFLHPLYSMGRKSRTVDSAKTALVSFFKESSISPNPAQDMHAKRYVIGLQKYNRQSNVDDEKKAHPLTVHELSTLINLFANHNPFDESGRYVSIRLRWHKKASVEKECQVYHLVDEASYPCLRICTLYEGYLDKVRQTQVNVSQEACVFPSLSNQYDSVRVDWFKPLDQNYVRRLLQDLVHAGLTFDSIVEAVQKGMGIEQPKPVLPPARQRQLSLRECVVTKSIPTARSARDAWDQWFTACPKSGLFCAIKDFTKDMIKCDRRKIHAQ